MTPQSFELGEKLYLGGQYSWRLKDGELRYRGSGEFANQILGRIPVSNAQIETFIGAVDLLQVWEWRDDYNPREAGFEVADGGEWWFNANLDERTCNCGGCNAFPSYGDFRTSSLAGGRFALLRTALYDVFAIEAYIEQARRFEQRASELARARSDEPSHAPEPPTGRE